MLKRYSVVFALFVIVIAIVIGVSVDITSRWNNDKYWTYENTISILKQSPGTITRETINGVEVVFEYGLLYSIQTDGDKVKLNFSYEPYDVYQLRTPQNRYPETDLSVTVNTKTDPQPSAFLGRIDKSSTSVKSLGTNSALVTAGKVQFSYSKPKMELQSLWNHYIKAITGKKSDYNVKITSWYVEDLTRLAQKSLNNLTPDRKAELRKKWKEETEKYLVEYFKEEELLSSKYEGKEFLREIKERFKYVNLSCRERDNSELNCVGGYIGRPGTNFMMYMFVRNNSGKTAITDKFLSAARISLYPFNPNAGTMTIPNEFTQMNTNGYPVCPIVEIYKNNLDAKNIKLYTEYYKIDYEARSKGVSDKEMLEKLKSISIEGNNESPDDLVTKEEESIINVACYRVIVTKNKNLENELIRVYRDIFESILVLRDIQNGNVVLKKVPLDEFIAVSGNIYGSNLLTDYYLLQSRIDVADTKNDQIDKKMEYKMLLKSYIILYLYEIF